MEEEEEEKVVHTEPDASTTQAETDSTKSRTVGVGTVEDRLCGESKTNISMVVNMTPVGVGCQVETLNATGIANYWNTSIKAKTKEEIEEETANMIRVSFVDTVVNKMRSGQHWVTITGNAGDGKTTLGNLVVREFLQEDVKVYFVKKPKDYRFLAGMKEKMKIVLDDVFGEFGADRQRISKWIGVIKSFRNPMTQTLFICRKDVMEEYKVEFGHLTDKIFNKKCVVDLSESKLPEERLKILNFHLDQGKLTVHPEIKKRVCKSEVNQGFPHCCKMFSKLQSKGFDVSIEEFFKSPLKFLDRTTKSLYHDKCKRLFQLMIKNDGKLDVDDVKDEDERHSLLKVVKEQKGSYIMYRNGTCVFAHPSVYESVLNVINDFDPKYCVKYATLSVIRQKIIISTSEEDKEIERDSRSPCYIIIKPETAVLKALAERFRGEILTGDYYVFKHRLCNSKGFCEALVSCCVSKDDKEKGSKQFINKPGEDGESMLWTALKSRNMVAVQVLVQDGADVNIRDRRGRTPLQYLCQLKHYSADADAATDTVRVIIKKGRGDVDVRDENGQTPLHYLCQLKSSTANDDGGHFVDMETIKVIITEGRGDVNALDHYGQTPLHYLFRCKTLTIEELLSITTAVKGDLNHCEHNKSTPMHYLCAFSSLTLNTVDQLIKGGGDFNKGDEHRATPLHYLTQNGKVGFDIVLRVINTANGDINKQDDNGTTPLHFLCKGSLPIENLLTLIKQGDADMFGNTPLHYICRRPGINADMLQQQLEQITETDKEKRNSLGYTPLDYLTDQAGNLPWTDGMVERSAADLVLCRWKQGDTWILVVGPPMTLSTQKVHQNLQIENFDRTLTNTERSGSRRRLRRFSWFHGTCSSPIQLPPSPTPLTTPCYWETSSKLTPSKKSSDILIEMGVAEGQENLDEVVCVSDVPRSVCVSVTDTCKRHRSMLCIKVYGTEETRRGQQVGQCIPVPRPMPGGVLHFTFGLVLDVSRKVAFIDVERERVLGKVDMEFTEEVVPLFYVSPRGDCCSTRMALVSGHEIFVNGKKRQLIQQALST